MTAVKVNAALEELDAAYADLRTEAYPYPTQYQRVEDAKREVMRAAMEAAWEEGYFAGLDRNGYHGPDLNPYREVKS